MSPLTPVDARVAASVFANWRNHPGGVPTWAGIAQRLSAWADQQPHTEHETEDEHDLAQD